jgi:vacuolar-type H+-ATPase subunit E/Vma4
MVQKPLKKVRLLKKETKYKKILQNAKTENQILTKEINKAILERFRSVSRSGKKGAKASKRLLG